jgi:predicted nucleic acid-binding protein
LNYLLDTNVVSELRKGKRCHPAVSSWHQDQTSSNLWLSVLVIAEIRRGVERLRTFDPTSAAHIAHWLDGLEGHFSDRILPITIPIAHRWGHLNAPDPTSPIDGFLAATALEHNLVLVTRNVSDFSATKVPLLNPFDL